MKMYIGRGAGCWLELRSVSNPSSQKGTLAGFVLLRKGAILQQGQRGTWPLLISANGLPERPGWDRW